MLPGTSTWTASADHSLVRSVKVKDSKTGQRSIAHFYRDCQIWPLLDPAVVLANASRPIHASTAGSLSVIGAGKKVKLTAMLPRMTWLAGQRCYVHLSVTNETKKTVKTIKLALVRTTTVFKPRPALNSGNGESVDPGVCQTATTHKVIAESILERCQGVAKGHASVQGWWTGVPAGQDTQFAHYISINVSSAPLSLTNLLLTITSPFLRRCIAIIFLVHLLLAHLSVTPRDSRMPCLLPAHGSSRLNTLSRYPSVLEH